MGATKQPGPRLIDYQYDAAGRLTTTTFPLGSITRTYDTAGRLAQVAGPTGVTMTYGYDGSLLKTIGWSGAITGSVERTFDSDFRVVGETVGGAWPVSFGYDADSLLTSAGGLQLFRDPLNGRLTGTKIGQVADTYTYDAFGQVQTYSASFGVTPLLSFAYVRDDLGRIVSKTETERGVSKVFGYSYDTVGRLIEVSENGVVTESYEYDLNGNRTQSFNSAGSFAATYDDQDRILTYGSLTFTWTPNGEMASKTDTATGEVTTYSYDALGNLREVVLPDGTDITYLVDGQGRRVGKLVNGVFERGWLWRGQLQPVAELDATGAVAKRFVYAGGVNAPSLMVTPTATYRLVKDHLGSVRQVVDQGSGLVPERIRYDAWGRTAADSNPGTSPFGFAGGLEDDQAADVTFGARRYDPVVGRWMRKDPVGLGGGLGVFSYCADDPVNHIDPTGLFDSSTVTEIEQTLAQWVLPVGTFLLGGPEIVGTAVDAAPFVGAAIGVGAVGYASYDLYTQWDSDLLFGSSSVDGSGAPMCSLHHESNNPANDNDQPPQVGISIKGPPGPKSRGVCDLERDLVDVGDGVHYCQYFCAQIQTKFTLLPPLPTGLPCPEQIGFGN